MADTTQLSEISAVIGESWCSAEGAGLAEGISPESPYIRGLTDAVARGILSASPAGLTLKGWLFADSGETVTTAQGLQIESRSHGEGTESAVVAPASMGARVLVVFGKFGSRAYFWLAASEAPGELTVFSSDLDSGKTDFTLSSDLVALAF